MCTVLVCWKGWLTFQVGKSRREKYRITAFGTAQKLKHELFVPGWRLQVPGGHCRTPAEQVWIVTCLVLLVGWNTNEFLAPRWLNIHLQILVMRQLWFIHLWVVHSLFLCEVFHHFLFLTYMLWVSKYVIIRLIKDTLPVFLFIHFTPTRPSNIWV